MLRLLRAQIDLKDVVTNISLEKAESSNKIKFAKVALKAGARLDPQAKQRVREYAALMAPAMDLAARVEQDEVG